MVPSCGSTPDSLGSPLEPSFLKHTDTKGKLRAPEWTPAQTWKRLEMKSESLVSYKRLKYSIPTCGWVCLMIPNITYAQKKIKTIWMAKGGLENHRDASGMIQTYSVRERFGGCWKPQKGILFVRKTQTRRWTGPPGHVIHHRGMWEIWILRWKHSRRSGELWLAIRSQP